jgi:acyl-CoA thioester hydrolase
MGVVHHTHYFVWFEIGRTELMRDQGRAYSDMEKDGIFMPVVEAQCRFHAPGHYDEEVEVETRVVAASRVRVEFGYKVTRPADGRLLAMGSTVHAATDRNGTPRRMPGRILQDLGLPASDSGGGQEAR